MTTYYRWGDPSTSWGNSGTLWGDPIDPATDPVLYWMIEIDWANSGIYSGENEAQYCIDMETNSGRTNRLNIDSNGNADGIQMPAVGTARLVLDNTTGRFDPYNTGGALYGDILPGRYIRIRVTYHGVIYPVFHGNIMKITPSNTVENPTVTLDCENGMRLLQQSDVSISMGTDVYMRNAVYQILQDMSWPSRFGTNLTGVELPASETWGTYFTIPYFTASGSPKERLKELMDAYCGNFWVDETGAARFEHFGSLSVGSSLFTIGEDNVLKDISVSSPWENIINTWNLYYYAYQRQAVGTIWQDADNTTEIAAGASIEIWAEYTFNNEQCQAVGVIAPVATTDYTMNTASDGSGTNLTASFTVTQSDFGNKSKLTITNNSASTGYKTLLKIRGEALTTNASYYKEFHTPSINSYGIKTITLKSPYCQRYATAERQYTIFLDLLNADERIFEVQIEARPDQQFDTALFHAVNVLLPTFGISSPSGKIISHINHKWLTQNGQAVRTTLLLEDAY